MTRIKLFGWLKAVAKFFRVECRRCGSRRVGIDECNELYCNDCGWTDQDDA